MILAYAPYPSFTEDERIGHLQIGGGGNIRCRVPFLSRLYHG